MLATHIWPEKEPLNLAKTKSLSNLEIRRNFFKILKIKKFRGKIPFLKIARQIVGLTTPIDIKRFFIFCYNWDPCNIGNAYPTWPRAPEFSKGKKSKLIGKSTELFRDIENLDKFKISGEKSTFFKLHVHKYQEICIILDLLKSPRV